MLIAVVIGVGGDHSGGPSTANDSEAPRTETPHVGNGVAIRVGTHADKQIRHGPPYPLGYSLTEETEQRRGSRQVRLFDLSGQTISRSSFLRCNAERPLCIRKQFLCRHAP